MDVPKIWLTISFYKILEYVFGIIIVEFKTLNRKPNHKWRLRDNKDMLQ